MGEDPEAGGGEMCSRESGEERILKYSSAESNCGYTAGFTSLFTGGSCPSGKVFVEFVSGTVDVSGGKFESHCRFSLKAAVTLQPQQSGAGIE